ncbi:zinc ABC transporter ATP-binding protein AztA [Actinomadura sp. 3N407]|uniref:zinc ABC transporter ATP-binding protein AztA n=1 Tax=Actinomadura sp. 3N407 TaxID=3457423 RepID=UPI003FCE7C0F
MSETAITMREMRAGYGSTPVLHDITARIPRSRVTALVGHNGSGKSTLLGVLAGTLAPSGGTVERSCSQRPALVLQRAAVPATLPMTAWNAVAMGRWAHRGWWRRLTKHDKAVVSACMERVGVAELAKAQLGELSGGQYQRTLIAQGLAQQSDLLLLDEPAAGLDHDAQNRILEIFDELTETGVTVVHATHDADAATRADHCLLLKEGRLLAQDISDVVLRQESMDDLQRPTRPRAHHHGTDLSPLS